MIQSARLTCTLVILEVEVGNAIHLEDTNIEEFSDQEKVNLEINLK